MRKLLLLTLFISYATFLNATIITVDNNFPRIGQYATIQEAHDTANDGDTIYVYPSQKLYPGITVTKKIILLGSGFSMSQTNIQKSYLGNITLSTGSHNSIIEGFDGNFEVVMNENNIIIRKNKLGKISFIKGHFGNIISQNFIINSIVIESENEVLFINNIILKENDGNPCITSQSSNSSITLDHNIFRQQWGYFILDLAGASLKMTNCILSNQDFLGVNTSESYNNICNGNQLSSTNGNLPNTLISDVFVDVNNFDFHLKTNSPAKEKGSNGVDIGAYGGDTPFIDGGYPSIPTIYFLDVPLTANQKNGINVTIKAKSNQ